MGNFAGDIRYALRALLRQRSFAFAVLATIALGVGASTSVFSLLDATVLREPPFPNASRMVFGWGVAMPQMAIRGASVPESRDWGRMSHTLEGLSLYNPATVTLQTSDGAERIPFEMVSANYFQLLGVTPQRGRVFTAEEDSLAAGAGVAVISHSMWTERFSADPDIVGRSLVINDSPVEVIGVMRQGFSGLSFNADVWMTAASLPPGLQQDRGSRWLGTVAVLKEGVPLSQAQLDLNTVADQLRQSYPEFNDDRGVQLFSLRSFLLGNMLSMIWILFGAVTVFLLIAAANVSGLQLVRATTRRREMALRRALGASGGRILRQLATEGVILALAGGVLGVLASMWCIDLLTPLIPDGLLPAYAAPRVNGTVLLFSLGLCIVCGIAFGLAPVLSGRGPMLITALKEGAANLSSADGAGRTVSVRKLLVASEVALAIVLLVSAGLMIRSLQNQLRVETGYEAEGILAGRFALPGARYDTAGRRRFVNELHDRLANTGAIESVAMASTLPLRGASASFLVRDDEPDAQVRYYRQVVSRDYFDVLGISVTDGRAFQASDATSEQAYGLISESSARRLWPGQSAVGHRIRFGNAEGLQVEIVGVVEDARLRDLTTDISATTSEPDLFLSMDQFPQGGVDVALKSRDGTPPEALTEQLRRALQEMDPTLPLYNVSTLESLVRSQTAGARFGSTSLTAFGIVALVLAAVGLYGMLAYLVGVQRKDIAIRLALGATATRVRAAVVQQGLMLALAGAVAGVAIGVLATRALRAQLFDVAPADPAVFLLVVLALLIVAALASLLPARRAARLQPQEVLRAD